jgi:hypothetical protein
MAIRNPERCMGAASTTSTRIGRVTEPVAPGVRGEPASSAALPLGLILGDVLARGVLAAARVGWAAAWSLGAARVGWAAAWSLAVTAASRTGRDRPRLSA